MQNLSGGGPRAADGQSGKRFSVDGDASASGEYPISPARPSLSNREALGRMYLPAATGALETGAESENRPAANLTSASPSYASRKLTP
jgi:hypothetical protein